MKLINKILNFNPNTDYSDKLTTMDEISKLGGYYYSSGKSYGDIGSGITEYILHHNKKPEYVIINCFHCNSKHKGIYLFKYSKYDGFNSVKKYLLK